MSSIAFRAALPMTVLLGALFFGCRTSKMAQPHQFSSPAAAERLLPHRLRNSQEHDAVRAEAGEPYVLDFTELEGGGALHYYGAYHTDDRHDPQVSDIRTRWEAFQPTVALCEGRKRRHFYGALVEPFAGLPEPTLVHKLARHDRVRLVSLEPEYGDEVAALLKRFEPEDVALYFFMRVYASESGGSPNDPLARDLLAKRTDVEGLRGSLSSLDDVTARWTALYPELSGWETTGEEPREGLLAEISTASRVTRGEHMVRALVDLALAGERVFAVVGSGHVIRQEWALRSCLGQAPAADQLRKGLPSDR